MNSVGGNKTITVLMSVYNGEKYLRDAIDSILAQTYTDFEFVIYDDCSTDRTSEIILSYSDRRIVYRHNNTNQGLTKNLADGLNRSNACYIVRMDADDIAYPQRLEKQVLYMNEHPEISILGSAVSYFKESPGDGSVAYQPTDDERIKATLFISFTLLHPSIIIRRSDLVERHINYNPDYRCSQDHELYLHGILKGIKFANLSEPLLYMRSHSGSISRAKHGFQQECSQRARSFFLERTGIAEECTAEEINSYNTFASGYFPETIEKLHSYERFTEKIYNNPKTELYFDKDLLRELMAAKLCDGAYEAVNHKTLRIPALNARKSELKLFSPKWSASKKLKFFIKSLISR